MSNPAYVCAGLRRRERVPRVAHARRMAEDRRAVAPASTLDLHTFSVVARDPRGNVGVAVATARPNVGSLVPWVSRRGAIATQARVDTDLGRQGIALLDLDIPIEVALPTLLGRDPDRER